MHRDDDQPTEGGLGRDAEAIRPPATPERTAEERERRARLAKVVAGLVLLIVLIVFVATNLDRTQVQFIFFDANVPLIWVMLGCAVIGGIVGYLLGKPGRQVGRGRTDKEAKR